VANTAQDLLRWHEALLQPRRLWEPVWDKIGRLTLPRKSGLQFRRTPGQRVEDQYTSTAVRANELLASSMQGSLTSGIVRWFALGDGTRSQNKAVNAWYEEFSERLYRNLVRSNFHQEMQEVYLDLSAFGTGCILMDEKQGRGSMFRGFRFQSQEIGTYVISEDGEGHVDVIMRMLRMSPRAAYTRWREKIGPRLLALKAKPDAAEEPVEILHASYPRDGVYGYKTGTHVKRLPYASCYVDVEGQSFIEESGFHEQALFAPRWTKVTGETWGRGPGFTAIGDVSSLNEAVKLNLQAWAMSVRPPLLRRHDGVIGTPKATPGSFIDVYDMEALRPLESGANHQVNVIERQALQDDIRNIFFWEQLQLPNQQLYTAYEVQKRLELMQRVLGPTLGRIEVELHQRVIMRGAAMMLRAGLRSQWKDPNGAPEPPDEVMEQLRQGIAEVDIEYLGPLARAQKAQDADALAGVLQVADPVIKLSPDAAVVYNFEEWLRYIAERRGLPARLTRDPGEVKKIQDQMKEEREKQAQMETMKTASEAARNIAPAIGEMGGMGALAGATQEAE
jgi:hypothetical protein